jgi:8-oxo-dGTP diphosphatase
VNTVRVVAGIAVSGNKLFIARRSPDKSLAGMWEFPGGKVEKNETDEAALKREIQEEFGKEIIIGEHFHENNYTDAEKTIKLVSYFMAFHDFPKKSDSHDQLKWTKIEDLTKYEFCPADREVVSKLLQGSN